MLHDYDYILEYAFYIAFVVVYAANQVLVCLNTKRLLWRLLPAIVWIITSAAILLRIANIYFSDYLFLYFCTYGLLSFLVHLPVLFICKKPFFRMLPSIIFVLFIPGGLSVAGVTVATGPGGWLLWIGISAVPHAVLSVGFAWLIYGIVYFVRKRIKAKTAEQDAE